MRSSESCFPLEKGVMERRNGSLGRLCSLSFVFLHQLLTCIYLLGILNILKEVQKAGEESSKLGLHSVPNYLC